MIYVTHDQVEAMTLADRIAIMKDGKIMQLASPHDIYNYPQDLYVADFIGSPSMNFTEGELDDGTFRCADIELPIDNYEFGTGSAHRGKVIPGIRPEHIATGDALASAEVRSRLAVDLVEPMGSDTLVYAELGGKTLHVRMDGQAQVQAGDYIEVGFLPSRASLYDPQTEARL